MRKEDLKKQKFFFLGKKRRKDPSQYSHRQLDMFLISLCKPQREFLCALDRQLIEFVRRNCYFNQGKVECEGKNCNFLPPHSLTVLATTAAAFTLFPRVIYSLSYFLSK